MEPAFDAQQAAYLAQHDEAKELLEAHSPKEGDGPECDEAVTVDGGPVIPAGFDLWVDVQYVHQAEDKEPSGWGVGDPYNR